MQRLVLATLLVLAACPAPMSTTPPRGPVAGPPVAAYSGPRLVKRGDRLDGNLKLGETHVFTIQLAAAEKLAIGLEGESGPNGQGSGCGNWSWGWKAPDGVEMVGNPLPLAPNPDGSGKRRVDPIEVAAAVPGGGEMAGKGGTWSFELRADPANCAAIRYRLAID
jgi:hypothetical protein